MKDIGGPPGTERKSPPSSARKRLGGAMWRTGTRAPHRNNRQPAILCTGQRGPGSGPPIMVTYRRSKAARTPTTASTRHHATKTFNQWKTSYTAQCLSTGRLKQGTAKNLLRHRTAQAGDGMHAEQRKHIVPTGIQPSDYPKWPKLARLSRRMAQNG